MVASGEAGAIVPMTPIGYQIMETKKPAEAIERTFRDLSDAEAVDIDKASRLARMEWSGRLGWDDILQSRRVLIVSEAGTGKTFECRRQQEILWNAGEPAYFLDLATLSGSSVRDMLTGDEERRLDTWLRSQSEVATFLILRSTNFS